MSSITTTDYNAQKTPFVKSIANYTREQLDKLQQVIGTNLPVEVVDVDNTGTIVTVRFDVTDPIVTLPDVQCPVATDRYARAPLQKGDKGYVVSADVYLGGVSGLGGGTATLTRLSNLSMLVFHPVGNTAFSPLVDANKYQVTGPKGVVLTTDDSAQQAILGPTPDGPKNCLLLEGLIAAVDDPDAKAKGVPLHGLYQNNGGVKIRLV